MGAVVLSGRGEVGWWRRLVFSDHGRWCDVIWCDGRGRMMNLYRNNNDFRGCFRGSGRWSRNHSRIEMLGVMFVPICFPTTAFTFLTTASLTTKHDRDEIEETVENVVDQVEDEENEIHKSERIITTPASPSHPVTASKDE